MSLPISQSVRISIICTILVEFCEHTDHFIGRYVSSPHLILMKSTVNISHSKKAARKKNISRVFGQSVSLIQTYGSSLQLSHRAPSQHWTGHNSPPLPSLPCSLLYILKFLKFRQELFLIIPINCIKVATDRAFNIISCRYHNLAVTLNI